MTLQLRFFPEQLEHDVALNDQLEGFRYVPQLITHEDELALLAHVRELPFKEFEFHGYHGKRRVVSFGWRYDYSGRELKKADDIPEFLLGVRALVASFAKLESHSFQHVLVTEYGPGAGIGWHRDKAVFGDVVGVSLLAPCVLRFRRRLEEKFSVVADPSRVGTQFKTGTVNDTKLYKEQSESRDKVVVPEEKRFKTKAKWERTSVTVEPRSAYHLTGPARSDWYHSILRVEALRYSITFRNLLTA